MKYVIGLVHRITYATLLSAVAWYACVTPSDSPKQRASFTWVCYVLSYPTAVVGRVTSPYRGIDVFFDHGGEWCDFCSSKEVLWRHLRFAVPVYVALFYVPSFVLWLARRLRKGRPNDSGEQSSAESLRHA